MVDEAKKQASEMKSRVTDYLRTFGSEHGKRVLKDMRKSYCGYTFDPNPFTAARNEGKREVVLDIESLLLMGKKPALIEELFQSPEDKGFEF